MNALNRLKSRYKFKNLYFLIFNNYYKMAYISFNNDNVNSPLKKDEQNQDFNCEGCIHRLLIKGGIYRCSIHNIMMIPGQNTKIVCNDKNIKLEKRKVIFCPFIYNDENHKYDFTGIVNFAFTDKDDDYNKNMLINDFEKTIIPKYPGFKDSIIVYFLIAEGTETGPFINKTSMLDEDTVDNIITDTINELNKQ